MNEMRTPQRRRAKLREFDPNIHRDDDSPVVDEFEKKLVWSAQKEHAAKRYGDLGAASSRSPSKAGAGERALSSEKYVNLARMTLATPLRGNKHATRQGGDESPTSPPRSARSNRGALRFSPCKMGPPLRILSGSSPVRKTSAQEWIKSSYLAVGGERCDTGLSRASPRNGLKKAPHLETLSSPQKLLPRNVRPAKPAEPFSENSTHPHRSGSPSKWILSGEAQRIPGRTARSPAKSGHESHTATGHTFPSSPSKKTRTSKEASHETAPPSPSKRTLSGDSKRAGSPAKRVFSGEVKWEPSNTKPGIGMLTVTPKTQNMGAEVVSPKKGHVRFDEAEMDARRQSLAGARQAAEMQGREAIARWASRPR